MTQMDKKGLCFVNRQCIIVNVLTTKAATSKDVKSWVLIYLWWTVFGLRAPCRISPWTWSPPAPRTRTPFRDVLTNQRSVLRSRDSYWPIIAQYSPVWGRPRRTRGIRGWTRGDRSPGPRWLRHPWPGGKFDNVPIVLFSTVWSSSSKSPKFKLDWYSSSWNLS